jgi:SAM-dependent methyltransferase
LVDKLSQHVARYRPGEVEAAPDGRLFSPVFLRTNPPITAALARIFGDADGAVIEIGSGTGQHAAAMTLAFPALSWIPSDPDPLHRVSIRAWAAEYRVEAPEALDLDASTDWSGAARQAAGGPIRAVVSMNVIHIAPWAVAQGIVAGAARVLAPCGWLIFYGPFREDGAHTGDGNRAFDARLRADNPDWGVRDVAEVAAIAEPASLILDQVLAMPANNRLVVFRKTG